MNIAEVGKQDQLLLEAFSCGKPKIKMKQLTKMSKCKLINYSRQNEVQEFVYFLKQSLQNLIGKKVDLLTTFE